MTDINLLLEAEKRGILPQEKVALLSEARKRGLVPLALQSQIPQVSQTPEIRPLLTKEQAALQKPAVPSMSGFVQEKAISAIQPAVWKPVPALAASSVAESAAGVARLVGSDEIANEWGKNAKLVQEQVQTEFPLERGSWPASVRDALVSMYVTAPTYTLGLLGQIKSGLTLMGAQTGLGKYEELKEADVGEVTALAGGAVSGISEFITEIVPFTVVLDILKKAEPVGRGLLKNFLSEHLGEQINTVVDYVIDQLKPNKKWDWDEYLKRAQETFNTTTVQSMLTGGLAAAGRPFMPRKQAVMDVAPDIGLFLQYADDKAALPDDRRVAAEKIYEGMRRTDQDAATEWYAKKLVEIGGDEKAPPPPPAAAQITPIAPEGGEQIAAEERKVQEGGIPEREQVGARGIQAAPGRRDIDAEGRIEPQKEEVAPAWQAKGVPVSPAKPFTKAGAQVRPEPIQFPKEPTVEPVPPKLFALAQETPRFASITQAKAKGKSFDEWEKEQYDTPRLKGTDENEVLFYYDAQSKKEWLGGQIMRGDIITVYRASIKGQPIKPGDYVTNSPKYAEDHIKYNLRGNGEITSLKVSLKEMLPADAPKEFWYRPTRSRLKAEWEAAKPTPPKPEALGKPSAKAGMINAISAAELGKMVTQGRIDEAAEHVKEGKKAGIDVADAVTKQEFAEVRKAPKEDRPAIIKGFRELKEKAIPEEVEAKEEAAKSAPKEMPQKRKYPRRGAGIFYRSFDAPEDALGPDVSVSKDDMDWSDTGPYQIKIVDAKGEYKSIPHHGRAYRGDFSSANVVEVRYNPAWWVPEERESVLKDHFPKLRRQFPEAEFIELEYDKDNPEWAVESKEPKYVDLIPKEVEVKEEAAVAPEPTSTPVRELRDRLKQMKAEFFTGKPYKRLEALIALNKAVANRELSKKQEQIVKDVRSTVAPTARKATIIEEEAEPYAPLFKTQPEFPKGEILPTAKGLPKENLSDLVGADVDREAEAKPEPAKAVAKVHPGLKSKDATLKPERGVYLESLGLQTIYEKLGGTGDIQGDIALLTEAGKRFYAEGSKDITSFSHKMRAFLKEKWARYESLIGKVFGAAKNWYSQSYLKGEEGAISTGKAKVLGIADDNAAIIFADSPKYSSIQTKKDLDAALSRKFAEIKADILNNKSKYYRTQIPAQRIMATAEAMRRDGNLIGQQLEILEAYKDGRINDEQISKQWGDAMNKTAADILGSWVNYLKGNTTYSPYFQALMIDKIATEVAFRRDGEITSTALSKNTIDKDPMSLNIVAVSKFYADLQEGGIKGNWTREYLGITEVIAKEGIINKKGVTAKDKNVSGKWVHYKNKEDVSGEEEFHAQVSELSALAQTTPWCTRYQASAQLKRGDHHVFVDDTGKARATVYVIAGEISEVRGVLDENQNMEPELGDIILDFVKKKGFPGGEGFVIEERLKKDLRDLRDSGEEITLTKIKTIVKKYRKHRYKIESPGIEYQDVYKRSAKIVGYSLKGRVGYGDPINLLDVMEIPLKKVFSFDPNMGELDSLEASDVGDISIPSFVKFKGIIISGKSTVSFPGRSNLGEISISGPDAAIVISKAVKKIEAIILFAKATLNVPEGVSHIDDILLYNSTAKLPKSLEYLNVIKIYESSSLTIEEGVSAVEFVYLDSGSLTLPKSIKYIGHLDMGSDTPLVIDEGVREIGGINLYNGSLTLPKSINHIGQITLTRDTSTLTINEGVRKIDGITLGFGASLTLPANVEYIGSILMNSATSLVINEGVKKIDAIRYEVLPDGGAPHARQRLISPEENIKAWLELVSGGALVIPENVKPTVFSQWNFKEGEGIYLPEEPVDVGEAEPKPERGVYLESLGLQTIYEKLGGTGDIQGDMALLTEAGKRFYADGAKNIFNFGSAMKKWLGGKWDKFKSHIAEVFKAVREFNKKLGEEGAAQIGPTWITKEAIREERAERMELPLKLDPSKPINETHKRVIEEIEKNSDYLKDVIEKLYEKHGSATPEEIFAVMMHYKDKKKRRNYMFDQGMDAEASGDTDAIAESHKAYMESEAELAKVEEIARRIGRSAGRVMRYLQEGIEEDYSLANIERKIRAAKGFKPLSEEETRILRAEFAKAEKMMKEIEKREADIKTREKNVDEMMAKLKKEIADEAKAGEKRAPDKAGVGDRVKKGKTAAGKIEGATIKVTRLFANSMDTDKEALHKSVRALVLAILGSNPKITRDELVNTVHTILVAADPSIPVQKTMDAISGRGVFRLLSQKEVLVKYRDIKNQLRFISHQIDVKARKPLPKTGFEREKLTDAASHEAQILEELKRRFGVVVEDTSKHLASLLQSRLTYYTNKINSLKFEIETGERIIKTEAELTAEDKKKIEEKKEELKQVQKDHDEIFGIKGLTDQQRLIIAISRAKKHQETQLKKLEYAKKRVYSRGRGEKITSSELEAIRLETEAIKSETQELIDANTLFQEAKEVLKLEDSIDEYERKIKEKEYFTKAKDKPDNEAIQNLRRKKELLRKALQKVREESPQGRQSAILKATKALEDSIAALEKQIKSGELTAKSRKPKYKTEELDKLRKERDDLLKIKRQMVSASKPKKSRYEVYLQSAKTRALKQLAELQNKIAAKDFTKRERVKYQPDNILALLRGALSLQREKFKDMEEKAIWDRMSWKPGGGKLGKTAEIIYFDVVRMLVATGEMSVVARQGIPLVLRRPLVGSKVIRDAWRSFLDPVYSKMIEQEILDDPDYPASQAHKDPSLRVHISSEGDSLTKKEEMLMGKWALRHKIPVIPRFNRAAITFLNKMRFDSWKIMRYASQDLGFPNTKDDGLIARYVNEATGRYHFGKFESSIPILSAAFFAPRYMVSRFTYLKRIIPAVLNGISGGNRGQRILALEYSRTILAWGVYIYMLALLEDWLDDKNIVSIGMKPWASDFLRIRIGEHKVIDPLAGFGQAITFTARVASASANAIAKIVGVDLGLPEVMVRRGGKYESKEMTGQDFLRFGVSKAHPIPPALVAGITGKYIFGGEAPLADVAAGLTYPMTYRDIWEAWDSQNIPLSVMESVWAFWGISVNTYEERVKKRKYKPY